MIKKRFAVIVLFLAIMLTSGCNSDLELERRKLQSEIETLQSELNTLQRVREGLIPNDNIIYVIELQIRQTHITFDIGKMLEDAANEIILPIQVSAEYYHSLEIGDILNDELLVGSLSGNLGSWEITVVDKQIVNTSK